MRVAKREGGIVVKRKQNASPPEVQNKRLPHGLLLELENLAFKGRQLTYDTMKEVLKAKGVELTPSLFSRHCVERCAFHGIGEIIKAAERPRISVEKLVTEIREKVKEAFVRKPTACHPAIRRLVEEAVARGHRVAVLTCLDDDVAKQVMAGQGLEAHVKVFLSCACAGKNYPSAASMVKAASGLDLPPGGCVAVCTCSSACRAALASGMRSVAVPDRFTGFQDFSGADHVLDEMDNEGVGLLLEAMERS